MKRVKIKVASVLIGGKLYRGGVETIVSDEFAEWLEKLGYGKIIEDIKIAEREEKKTPPPPQTTEVEESNITETNEEGETDGEEKEKRKKREKRKEVSE